MSFRYGFPVRWLDLQVIRRTGLPFEWSAVIWLRTAAWWGDPVEQNSNWFFREKIGDFRLKKWGFRFSKVPYSFKQSFLFVLPDKQLLSSRTWLILGFHLGFCHHATATAHAKCLCTSESTSIPCPGRCRCLQSAPEFWGIARSTKNSSHFYLGNSIHHEELECKGVNESCEK